MVSSSVILPLLVTLFSPLKPVYPAFILGSAVCSAPSAQLPIPTGPFSVGTRFTALLDDQRTFQSGDQPPKPRQLLFQWWYPTRDAGKKASYIPDDGLIDEMIARGYYEQEKSVIDHWRALKTDAVANAKIARTDQPWPLVIFSHGLGVSRFNYSILAQEVASQGFVIALVDHPYGGFSRTPDGTLLTTEDDPHLMEKEGLLSKRISEWVGDFGFLIHQIASRHGALDEFAGVVDLAKVAAMGHSLGGNAALEAGLTDSRIKAAIDLDGAPLGRIASDGLGCPSLVLGSHPDYSDEDLAKRGRTRKQWEQMGKEIQSIWHGVFAAGKRVPIFRGDIKGTGHMHFSDAPFVMPNTISRFGGKMIDANRSLKITSRVVVDFLNHFLRGRQSWSPEDLRDAYPELTLTRWKPDSNGDAN